MMTRGLPRWISLSLFLLVSACTFPIPITPKAALFPTPVAHRPGVADLWQNRPAPGETVEVDAYFNGIGISTVGPIAPGHVRSSGPIGC